MPGAGKPQEDAPPIGPSIHDRIDRDFDFHQYNDEQRARRGAVAELGKALAHAIAASTPTSREQSLALTNLEQAMFWVGAAIAREKES